MRPPSHIQSALRSPLNELLGTEASVRILRVLAAGDTPLSASEIARRTQLGLSGVGKAVGTLIDSGIVESVGSGSRSPVRLRDGHPLAVSLRELFRSEREQFEHLIERLRAVASQVKPLPQAVWVQGPAARGDDRTGDPLVIGLLAATSVLGRVRDAFDTEVEAVERDFDVTIETRAASMADLQAASPALLEELRDVMPLLGPPPLSLLSAKTSRGAARAESRIRSHHDLDVRGRALASAIGERLRTDPSLVPRARTYIARRLTTASSGEQRELREWDRVLRTMSLAKLRRFLVDPGERATRLRQTLPFLGVLTPAEREQLVRLAVSNSAEE